MPEDGFVSELARELAPDALDRFLRYVASTRSPTPARRASRARRGSSTSPAARRRAARAGADRRELDEHGYVMATVPATAERDVPTIGFVAHVDTSARRCRGWRRAPGRPLRGRDAVPARRPDAWCSTRRTDPKLAEHIGHRLVTSDGTTLLGADDKAGVAEIMAAAAFLPTHPELQHGPVRIAFTPDEEVGRGTDRTSTSRRFGAGCRVHAGRRRPRRGRGRDVQRARGDGDLPRASARIRVRERPDGQRDQAGGRVRGQPAARTASPRRRPRTARASSTRRPSRAMERRARSS